MGTIRERSIGMHGRLLAVLAVLLLATVALTSGASAVGAEGATTTTASPPSPYRVGPYRVGRETVQIRSGDGRRVRTMDVWYPADPSTRGRPSRYLEPMFPTIGYNSHVAMDQVPASKAGPFPLVMYSHGSGGSRFIAAWFAETVASHGFVVASVGHAGDTYNDIFNGIVLGPNDGPRVIANRVADLRLGIDSLLARSTKRGDRLFRTIIPNRIGVTGHSYGGLTAFASSGGINPNYGGPTIGRDARVRAIVTMDATPRYMGPEDLKHVRVPVMSIGGDGFASYSASYWHYTRSPEFIDVGLDKAGHNGFTQVCQYQELASRYPDAPPLVINYINAIADADCVPPNMPYERVHSLTNRYAVSFLKVHLAGDMRYDKYLTEQPPASDVHVSRPEQLTSLPLPLPQLPPQTDTTLVID